ncbi:hypothetical protein PL11201_660094 [Planktothrix sp. PCC 11201]|nr:hypothetical protein PL11201_100002 [Planktothrix sp. PCC 11201]SKB14551.1 hypothetical protein PL11201_660094 [Planktothrix sp. PCC 11201]
MCLLVYNLAQRKLRKQLETAQEGVKNQVKKLTNKPKNLVIKYKCVKKIGFYFYEKIAIIYV